MDIPVKVNPMTIYISGSIEHEYYKSEFYEAENLIRENGDIALSLVAIPAGVTVEAKRRIGAAMLEECEAIMMLPNWKNSETAMSEYGRAAAREKLLLLFAEAIEHKKKDKDDWNKDKMISETEKE